MFFTSSLSVFFNTALIIPANSTKSASLNPRVVNAGDPKRIPLVTKGLNFSKGIVFLLHVIPTSSNTFCASFPLMPQVVTSASNT